MAFQRGRTEGKFVTLIDVVVISLIASVLMAFFYFRLNPEQLERAGMSIMMTTNIMVLLAVTGIMFFIVRRIK